MTVLALPGAHVRFSTRRGGVSEGPYESLNLGVMTDDDPARVARNRHRLARSCGLEPTRVTMGRQVHGTRVREWTEPPADPVYAQPGGELEEVDGHATERHRLGLLVLTADCYPVALSDGRRAAILHCGWRGLAGGILESALDGFGEVPQAAVGPGIGGCCYEVGEDVLAAFPDLDGVADGRMLDLRAVISRKLGAAGVNVVQHVEHCTACRDDLYFSHRRDHGVTGRQGGLLALDARR